MSTGPLAGVRVIELGGIGPGPYCCMLLAELGADVLRVERPEPPDLGPPADLRFALLNRSKRSVSVDLRNPHGLAVVKTMIGAADVLVEGFRPGVAERLGLGPIDCAALNEALVYGRMTGWGQDGPLAGRVGHDINYVSLTGALHAIGPKNGPPVVPLNLIGDFGGGALFLALGIVSALFEKVRSGKGQVVDAAMVDGVSSLLTSAYGALARGAWQDERGENMLDGGAPWYSVYETSDKKHISIGSIEGRFYRELLRKMGLEGEPLPQQHDRSGWPELRRRFTEVFLQRTRDEWCTVMQDAEVCFAPVLSIAEAHAHPHMKARAAVIERDGMVQPGAAPRLSRTPSVVKSAPALPGQHTDEVLASFGYSQDAIASLRKSGAVA